MDPIDNVYDFNFKKVAVDENWNVSREKELKMHKIHAYPAKFPAFITTKAIEYAKNENVEVNKIADIFCGCGTTALEAKRENVEFWGCDINPVAILIAETKGSTFQTKILIKYLDKIINNFNDSFKYNVYPEANQRLRYWYYENEYNELFFIKKAILDSTPKYGKYQRFFLCAFSNILKPTSKWLSKSIKPQIDPKKEPKIVKKSFVLQCNKMIRANDELGKMGKSELKFKTGNFLNNNLKKPAVDLIVTSPPYVTSYEYADLHQLSTLWLGYVEDYRDLRSGTIGSSHLDSEVLEDNLKLNRTGEKIVNSLYKKEPKRAKSVKKYFLDMQKVAINSYEMLNDDGMAMFVIGNTEFKGVVIDNAKQLSESMINAGFSNMEVAKRKISKKILSPYRDKNGRFTSDKRGRKVYSEEFIVVGRKRGG